MYGEAYHWLLSSFLFLFSYNVFTRKKNTRCPSECIRMSHIH